MKICYHCDHENFISNDNCEHCNNSIANIKPESFNIAGFLRRNYTIYGIFGILVAIFEYMLKELPPERKFICIFPLLIALYLILHLIAKGSRIIKSREWRKEDEILRRESFFHYYIFFIIHTGIIISLLWSLVSIADYATNIVGFVLGAFIFIVIFSHNFTYEQNRECLKIFIYSILFLEIGTTLYLLLPFIARAITDQIFEPSLVANFAFCYTWGTQLLFYLGFGGLVAYFIISSFNLLKGGNLSISTSSEHKQVQERPDNLELFIGIALLYGIILIFFMLSINSLYAGFN